MTLVLLVDAIKSVVAGLLLYDAPFAVMAIAVTVAPYLSVFVSVTLTLLLPTTYFPYVESNPVGSAVAIETDGLTLAEKLGAEVIWVRQNGELLMTGGVEIVKN